MNQEYTLPASTDVLVIGHGPVGAALSCLLGRQDVDAVIVDVADDILQMPRAIALDNEALRILQMAGLDEQAFERIPIPEVRMHCPHVGLFNRVNTSGHIDGHYKLVTFYQPEMERALRSEAARHDSIRSYSGFEMLDFKQDADGVNVRIRRRDGDVQTVRAKYLIGADGASSKVRGLIGQEFKGETYSEDWLIVDANQRHDTAIDHVEFICDPSRPTPHMPAPGGRERWEFMLQSGETREEMERPERIAELLKPWVSPADLTIERKAVYRFHARCCKRFQHDRVFLVGDAAHITPPFVGQGLVAGLRDVANLAWKLKWVLHHGADAGVLDSYDRERRPHAQRMINLAKLMGKLVMPSSRSAAIMIHGGMRWLRKLPMLRGYLEELEVKPENAFDEGCFARNKSHRALRTGAQFPQVIVQQDGRYRLSDDALGDALSVIGFGVDPQILMSHASHEAWVAMGGQCVQIGGWRLHASTTTHHIEDIDGALLASADKGWLVVCRPDRVIMDMAPAEAADSLVNTVLGLLGK